MFHRALMLILCALNIQNGQRCRLHPRIHFGEPLPVVIRNNKLLEPTDNFGNVELEYGETLTLSCEGFGNINHPNSIQDKTTASVTCEGGESFKNSEWLSAPASFSSFRCNFPPNHHSRRTNRTCFDGNTIIEIGYTIAQQFYPVFESCFNELTYSVIYSKYTQKPYNAHFQTRVDRPFFIADDNFGNIPVESLFSPRGQKSAVAQLVGSKVDEYFTKVQLLSRGHLAAKTDFVFAFGERASFHYVNCAPQWTGFNGGNWNSLEVDLRNHISLAKYNTVIYTGTFGVTNLRNTNGRRTDIYLYTDDNNNPVIPVPEYFYKVVYDAENLRGIAFVGINNPYYTIQEAQELAFCSDVCRQDDRFSWLTWHPDNMAEGYTFCCTVQDFRATVRHLPPFEVQRLFT